MTDTASAPTRSTCHHQAMMQILVTDEYLTGWLSAGLPYAWVLTYKCKHTESGVSVLRYYKQCISTFEAHTHTQPSLTAQRWVWCVAVHAFICLQVLLLWQRQMELWVKQVNHESTVGSLSLHPEIRPWPLREILDNNELEPVCALCSFVTSTGPLLCSLWQPYPRALHLKLESSCPWIILSWDRFLEYPGQIYPEGDADRSNGAGSHFWGRVFVNAYFELCQCPGSGLQALRPALGRVPPKHFIYRWFTGVFSSFVTGSDLGGKNKTNKNKNQDQYIMIINKIK